MKPKAIPSVMEYVNGIIAEVMKAGVASVKSSHVTLIKLDAIKIPT